MKILLDKLVPNPHQPRSYFDSEKLEELKESLEVSEQLEPIWVIPGTAPGIPEDIDIKPENYLIIDGERRWRNMKALGLNEVEVVVLDVSYQEAYQKAVVKQGTNTDWSHIEKARAAVIVLLNRFGGEEWFKKIFGEGPSALKSCADHIIKLRVGEVAKRKVTPEQESDFENLVKSLGGSLRQVAVWVERTKIPPDLALMVAEGDLNISAAEFIAGQKAQEGTRVAVAERIIKTPLPTTEIKKMVELVEDDTVPQALKDSLLYGEALPSALTTIQKKGELETLGKILEETKRISKEKGVTLEEAASLLGEQSPEFREMRRRVLDTGRRTRSGRLKTGRDDIMSQLVDCVAERMLDASKFKNMPEERIGEEVEGVIKNRSRAIRRLIERTISKKVTEIVELMFPDPDILVKEIERLSIL